MKEKLCKELIFCVGRNLVDAISGKKLILTKPAIRPVFPNPVTAVQCLSCSLYTQCHFRQNFCHIKSSQRGTGMTEGTSVLPCLLYTTCKKQQNKKSITTTTTTTTMATKSKTNKRKRKGKKRAKKKTFKVIAKIEDVRLTEELKKYGNKKWSLNFHDKFKKSKSYILLLI